MYSVNQQKRWPALIHGGQSDEGLKVITNVASIQKVKTFYYSADCLACVVARKLFKKQCKICSLFLIFKDFLNICASLLVCLFVSLFVCLPCEREKKKRHSIRAWGEFKSMEKMHIFVNVVNLLFF